MGQTACKTGVGSCREAVECWLVSCACKLAAVDRQAEGDLGHGVGWLGVLVGGYWV